MPDLLPHAMGQDTQPTPKKNGAPSDPAPVGTPAKTDDRPGIGAPPPAPPEIPPEQPATPEEKTDAASLFATKLQDAFKAELVQGYPTADKAEPGLPFALE